MELIILIIFIVIYVVRKSQKNANGSSSRETSRPSGDPYGQIPPPPKAKVPSAQAVQQTLNKHLFGSSTKPTDKYQIYKRFIEQDRYGDLEKLGHELGLSKYQVAADIKALQRQGYFKTVTVDDRAYKLLYTTASKYATRPTDTPPAKRTVPKPAKAVTSASAVSAEKDEELELNYVQPSDPYRPARNAGIRHEEWMQLPPHTQAVKCGYCGAGNAIPIGRRSKYTCYFCREEL